MSDPSPIAPCDGTIRAGSSGVSSSRTSSQTATLEALLIQHHEALIHHHVTGQKHAVFLHEHHRVATGVGWPQSHDPNTNPTQVELVLAVKNRVGVTIVHTDQ